MIAKSSHLSKLSSIIVFTMNEWASKFLFFPNSANKADFHKYVSEVSCILVYYTFSTIPDTFCRFRMSIESTCHIK